MSNQTADLFLHVQNWYQLQCDGDWEHTYGIKLETLDNPGWLLTIDLTDTDLYGVVTERQIDERSEVDWIQHESDGDKFVACGGIFNLDEIIGRFIKFKNNIPSK